MSIRSSRHLVDPALHVVLDAFPTVRLDDAMLAKMRARSQSLPVDPEAAAKSTVEIRAIPGPANAPDIKVHIYRPIDADGVLPCIYHIHGGGYVGGSADELEGVHRMRAADLGCCLISVTYRLAPETRFPGAIEDCYAGLAWVFANAESLKVDPTRIGVMGESAGGGLAAALALLARDRGEYRLAFQHLIYPMIDDRTCALDEPQPYAGEYIWTPHNNAFGWRALLGVEPGSDGVSCYAAAARAEDLKNLPPTFISTGALDLFVEENLEYARRLLRAGVSTEMHIYPGGVHGFDLVPGVEVSAAARRDSRAALSRFLTSAGG